MSLYCRECVGRDVLQLYKFLARRTGADFNRVVLKRLMMSKTNRPPMGVARLARYMKGKEDKIAVVVATITDDVRLTGIDLPKLKVCALRVTEGARARILKAGGEIYTFDQLAMMAPTGSNTILLRGRRTARTAYKFFGTPGQPGSKTRYVFGYALSCPRNVADNVVGNVCWYAWNLFLAQGLDGTSRSPRDDLWSCFRLTRCASGLAQSESRSPPDEPVLSGMHASRASHGVPEHAGAPMHVVFGFVVACVSSDDSLECLQPEGPRRGPQVREGPWSPPQPWFQGIRPYCLRLVGRVLCLLRTINTHFAHPVNTI